MKPFWQSKTLWVNLIAVVGDLMGVYGQTLSGDEKIAILGVINLILRFVTTQPVTLKL